MFTTRSKVILGTALVIILAGVLVAWLGTLASNPQAQSQPVDQLGQRLPASEAQLDRVQGGSLSEAAPPGQPQTGPLSPPSPVGSQLSATHDITEVPATIVAAIPLLAPTAGPLTTPSPATQPPLTPLPTRLPLVPPVVPPITPPVVLPPIPVPSPIPTVTPAPTALPPSSTVNIGLASNLSKVAIGQQFNLTVIVNAGTGKPVDAVQVYLDFDATEVDPKNRTGG